MTTYEKLIVALEDGSDGAVAAFGAWARGAAGGAGVGRAELEQLAADVQAAHTRKPVRYHAFASLWVTPDRLDEVRSAVPAPGTQWFHVRERLAFDRSARPDEARPWAGVKKTTPWAPMAGVEERIWRGRYTNHGETAKAYHATAVRYRQNVVIAGSDPEIGAVSELWWTNAEDLVERFYASAEAEQLVAIDTVGFVDAARAYPTVTTHEVLHVGAALTGTAALL